MKKLIFLFAIVLIGITANAQLKNRWQTITSQTSVGTGAIYFVLPITNFNLDNEFSIGGSCVQVGGISDGKITLEGSLDGTTNSWVPITNNVFTDMYVYPNDTLTVTSGAEFFFYVPTKFPRYRVKFIGTAGDTTSLAPSWIYN